MNEIPNVLILHSVDGQEWTHAVMYPHDWWQTKADRLALEAIKTAKLNRLADWSWEDIELELRQRGFIIPNWHNGPTWDD